MCMHYMIFVGVYHIDPATVGCLISLKTKLKICSSIGIRA